MTRRSTGWKKDPRKPFGSKVDKSALSLLGEEPPPEAADCVALMPDALDQAAHESCVGHAVAAQLYAAEKKAGVDAPARPSRAWLWFGGRLASGDQLSDVGVYPRAVLDWMRKRGYPPEALWPYEDSSVQAAHGLLERWQAMPDAAVFSAAYDLRDKFNHDYLLIANAGGPAFLDDCRRAIAAGQPIFSGFLVNGAYEHAQSAETVSLAGGDAGHGVVVVGYEPGRWLTQSSWGPGVGVEGRIWIDDASMVTAQDPWIVVRSAVTEVTA